MEIVNRPLPKSVGESVEVPVSCGGYRPTSEYIRAGAGDV